MFHNSYPIQNLQGIIHTRKQSRTVSCELIIQVLENVITVFERNISKLYCIVFWVKVKFVLLIQGKLQNEDWISVLPRELWVLSTLRIIDWNTTAFHSSSQTHLKKKKRKKEKKSHVYVWSFINLSNKMYQVSILRYWTCGSQGGRMGRRDS